VVSPGVEVRCLLVVLAICFHPGARMVAGAPASTLPSARDCFFAVHCEPLPPDKRVFDTAFEALRKTVRLAERYRVKITFEFTAQWAEMILADKQKLPTLRQWEKDGHEIGAHHHPIWVHTVWDGYTDIPRQDLKETRTDWLGKTHKTGK